MTTFEELSARRQAYVEAARDNGFEEGLRKLLADLYPDNAHFIYELLQNAEDAGAGEVIFNLQADGLEVRHNGARLFDLRDIESITGIGQSSKADDVTKIGKFGVGFKAVFAYTQTPVIWSGEHSFAIHDLFVPVAVPANVRDTWTTFWFPFDRTDKPAARAAREVANTLQEISQQTLLFLNNIQSIEYTIPDGKRRLLKRKILEGNIVWINDTHEGMGPSYWYRITGNMALHDGVHPIAAAFALERHISRQRENSGYTIKPINGQVFIYFPAAKETSGLKFHIHAPFASTVARDSVRDVPGNTTLVAGIAGLVTRALSTMRDSGLITDGLLGALPNDRDELPALYSILREQIITAFNNERLTPVVGGGHAPATVLLRFMRSTLSIDDANFLRSFGEKNSRVVATGWLPLREGRPRAFLDSLGAESFGRSELSRIFRLLAASYKAVSVYGAGASTEYNARLTAWENWISDKTDAWLRGFYVMLENLVPRNINRSDIEGQDFLDRLRAVPLIRVQDGARVRHVRGGMAHLPTTPGLRAKGLVIDSLAVFEGANDPGDQDVLRAFYRHANVRYWDTTAQMDARFQSYETQPASVTRQHLADLKALARLINEKVVRTADYEGRPILVAVRRDGSRYWASPTDAYLDAPISSTGLASLYESGEFPSTPPGRLDPGYVDATADVIGLARELGVLDRLTIAECDARDNPQFRTERTGRENYKRISTDWSIPHFDKILSIGDEVLLRGLWRLVVSAPVKYADAVYQANGSSRRHVMQSRLLQKLRTEAWILDQDGNLRIPADMTVDELAEGLLLPTSAPLLEHAEFGRKAATETQRHKLDTEVARKYGFGSPEEMQQIAELRKRDPEKFKILIKNMETELRLPDASTAVPEQRARRAVELAADAPARKYARRERSVYIQIPGHHSAARGYLMHFYTNEDQIMVCQVCTLPMPFQIDGRYYFEAVQFVKDSERDLRENRLALCPTCAAKYRHARSTSLQELRDALLSLEIESKGSVTVDVVLAGEETKIRFVGKHAIDLQAALAKSEITEDDDTVFP